MSTTITEPPNSVGAPAPRQSSARMKTLVLLAFAAVYVIWGSTYLAIRVGIESFPPFVLAGIRHVTAGLVLYAVFRRKTGIRPTGDHGGRRRSPVSCCWSSGMEVRIGRGRPCPRGVRRFWVRRYC